MAWRTDIENAPKGDTQEITLTHHRSKSSFTKTITVQQPVLLSVGGQTIKSHWSETRQQWVGVATNETPDAWQPWPKPYREGGL